MQIVVDGLMTHYWRAGKGKQIVILPGWAGTSANWQAFATALARSYDVTVLDLPGFGGSQTPDGAWDLDSYAGFVASAIAKLDLKPWAIIGHSHGGAITIHGVAMQMLQPAKVVLLASAGVRGERAGRKSVLQVVTKAGKLIAKPLPAKFQRKLRQDLYRRVGSDYLVAEHMEETFKKIVADDVRDDAAKVAVPTLLVYGEADTATPVRHGRVLAERLPQATLTTLPGAGHFLYRENQAEVLQLVEEFLA